MTRGEQIAQQMQVQAKADVRRAYAREMDRRLDYYEGRHRKHLTPAINRRYPRTCTRVIEHAEYYPLVRQVVNARAKAYWRQPSRELMTASGGAPADAAVVLWDTLAMTLDARLELADRMACLYGSCLVWPRYRERAGRSWLRWEVLGPQQVWVLQSEEQPDDIADAQAVIVELAGRTATMQAEQSRFAMYTQDEYSEFLGSVEGGWPVWHSDIKAAERHGYGMIPLVPWHDGEPPSGEMFRDCGPLLADANLAVNVKRTDLAYLVAMQSHGQLVLRTDNPQQEYGIGPDVPIIIDTATGNEGQDASYINPGAAIEQARAVIEWALKTDANAEGLSPNRFATDGRSQLSGIAKALDELDLVEDVTRRQRLYLQREAELFAASVAVWNAHAPGGKALSGLEQRVSFVPLTFPIDDQERLSAVRTKIDLGAIPAWRAVQEEQPDLTDEEAEEQWRANLVLLRERDEATREPDRFGSLLLDDAEPAAPVAAEPGAGEQPVTSEVVPAAAPEETLNGAQIKALQDVLSSVTDGALPKAAARELIAAAFPIAPDRIERMLAPLVEGATKPAPVPAALRQPGQAEPPEPPEAEDDDASA